MRKPLFSLLCLFVALAIAAQGKADLRLKSLMQSFTPPTHQASDIDSIIHPKPNRTNSLVHLNDGNAMVSVIVTLDAPETVGRLTDAGFDVKVCVGNYAACSLPLDRLDDLEAISEVRSITPAQRRHSLNNRARAATNVNDIHKGNYLKRPYLGDGVIIGAYDTGVDPNHINFMNDDLTETRVKRLWRYTYDESTGVTACDEYATPEEIASFTTDDRGDTHGTHVLGIAAGSYTCQNGDYRGMAPHADIAVACGDLVDDAIIAGLKNIVDYARAEGKPCVLNLSIGNNCGHHDGTDPFTAVINAIAAETPLFIAAGNSGDLDISLKKRLETPDDRVKTFLVPTLYTQSSWPRCQAYGNLEIIGEDDTPFTVTVGLYNTSTAEFKAQYVIPENEIGFLANESANVAAAEADPTFKNTYDADSYIGGGREVCADNGRYYCYLDFDLDNKSTRPRVFPAIIVDGAPGKRYEIYTEGVYTALSSKGLDGWDDPDGDGTINNIACGKNTIAVGAYCSSLSPDYTCGDVAPYSSYGTTADGRSLPHFCAPGQELTSSISKYYASGARSTFIELATFGGAAQNWGAMGGTSMAAPVAAGTAALWLEACPTLTPEEIRDAAVMTASVDHDVTSATCPTQWGAGKLDAHAGLLSLIGVTSSGNLSAPDHGSIAIKREGSSIIITSYSLGTLSATLVNLSGTTLAEASTPNPDPITLDTSSLLPGIYIIKARCDSETTSTKIAIR